MEILHTSENRQKGVQHCREVLFAPDGTSRGDIITDLDGTLLCNGNQHDFGTFGTWEIPLETIQVMRTAYEKGVGLSAITGKTWEKATPLFQAITTIAFDRNPHTQSIFTRPCMLEEGGVIWDPTNGEIIERISDEDGTALVLLEQKIRDNLHSNNGRVAHFNGQKTVATIAERGRTSVIVWDYGVNPNQTSQEEYELLLVQYQQLLEQVVRENELNNTSLTVYDIGGDGTFSFHPNTSSKAQIARFLAETANIAPLDRTVFLCNGVNDVELAYQVRAAGGGIICPDDAHPEIVNLAHVIGSGGAGYGISDALNAVFRS